MDKKEQKYLESYRIQNYDVPLTSVDVVIFTIISDSIYALVNQRKNHPHKSSWALPGGFIDIKNDKSIESTAIRKLAEKTGFKTPYLEQLGATGNGQRDPRGWSVTITYFALVNSDSVNLESDCRWIKVSTEGNVDESLAFDHNKLIEDAFQRLKNKAHYTTIPLHVLPSEFTLSELQSAYEIILGGKLNKSGFRRRILKSQIIEELPGEVRQTKTRTAQLYRALENKDLHFYMREIYAK
ncbi:NUDIX hydrolase [Pleionea sediminis]|uniref:NUDIX hydrolase n=1 Tax=Pleionea sediminis TaxID=2569479 RepID=UPI001185EE97|nr:NUDIX domain-containing protein [Pleionea sediminis]